MKDWQVRIRCRRETARTLRRVLEMAAVVFSVVFLTYGDDTTGEEAEVHLVTLFRTRFPVVLEHSPSSKRVVSLSSSMGVDLRSLRLELWRIGR